VDPGGTRAFDGDAWEEELRFSAEDIAEDIAETARSSPVAASSATLLMRTGGEFTATLKDGEGDTIRGEVATIVRGGDIAQGEVTVTGCGGEFTATFCAGC